MVSRVYFEVKQLIKLVYNDVKNLAYSLKDRAFSLFLCEIITFNKFCATPQKCYMRINKQLIKLVYNDVKNLAYSLMCSNGVQSVF